MVRGRAHVAVALVVTAQLLALVHHGPAAAIAGSDYDLFDAVTVNEVDEQGNEIAYLGPAKQWNTPAIDTSAFGIEDGESNAVGNLNGCLEDPPVFAGRTAWVRFNPGVDGSIYVRAFTPGYDSVLMVRPATEAPWGASQFGDLRVPGADCSDVSDAAGDESVGYCADPNPNCERFPVVAQRVYFVQVGGKCPGGPETCGAQEVPGGSTTIRIDFVPDDADGDSVPDTLDECDGTPSGTQVDAAGCPDFDGDGIADTADDCSSLAGVEADPPYNGCPEGPDPPVVGEPFVAIESVTGDMDNTADPLVNLRLNWPKGAQSVLLSNGDGTFESRDLDDVVA